MGCPKVTVLMAVYNGEAFLAHAIESILRQTYPDSELLIVDDASTDGTPTVIRTYQDPRIRVIRSGTNGGAAYARNVGLENAKGRYIAVLDADDIAYPERLARQVQFLDTHPGIALLGSAYDVIDGEGKWLGTMCQPTDSAVLRWVLLFRNAVATSTTMFRKEAALDVGGYDESLSIAEDYAFYERIVRKYELAQMGEVLCAYRVHLGGLTGIGQSDLARQRLVVSQRYISHVLGRDVDLSLTRLLIEGCEGPQPSKELANQAFRVLEECLATFLFREAKTRRQRRLVFLAALTNLHSLASCRTDCRFLALSVGLRLGICHIPEGVLSLEFLIFAAKTLVPQPMRNRMRRIAFWIKTASRKGGRV